MNKKGSEELVMTIVMVLIIVAIVGGIYFFKSTQPWWAEVSGESELRQAEQNRQIEILEAQANNEASLSKAEAMVRIAEAEAEAEIVRARGVAEANKIIGDSLQGNEDYLRYLYINQLRDTSNQVIYLPTEAGLPILEAKR